jgi:hypothetical protein
VDNLPQSPNEYGDGLLLQNSVEEAMAILFEISPSRLSGCTRQGDLLFFPLAAAQKKIAADVELHPAETWTPRESHDITSPSLAHNGVYFRAEHQITVTHTSHAAVILAAGEYRLYALPIVDVD